MYVFADIFTGLLFIIDFITILILYFKLKKLTLFKFNNIKM